MKKTLIKLIYISIVALFLCSCASTHKIVAIPMPVKYPSAKVPTLPNYPKLPKQAKAPDLVKWCIIGRKMCDDALAACLIQLKGYEHE